MYSEKNLVYLLTILEAIEKINIYAAEFENADDFFFANDQMNFNASQALLLAISEESRKIDAALKSEHPHIGWKEITGIRNRLAHDYRGIDPEIAFEIIREYIPGLKLACVEMISLIDYDPAILKEALESSFYKHIHYLKKLL